MALPLLIARFAALPWTGLLTNLVAVPVSGLLLAAAWLAALADWALPGAGRLAFSASEVLAWALRAIAGAGAHVRGAMLATGAQAGVVACAAAGAVLLALTLDRARDLASRERLWSRRRVAGAALGVLAAATAGGPA